MTDHLIMNTFVEELRNYISQNIEKYNNEIQKSFYKYETFGKTFEDYVLEDIKHNFDYIDIAENKNTYPDISVKKYNLALDVKCGNTHIKCKKDYKAVSSSNNDYGTINSWISDKFKLHKYHFVLFFQYTITNHVKKINRYFLNPIYYFVGGTNGFVSYREKDGNIRPKAFKYFNNPTFTSLQEFHDAIVKTDKKRSTKLVIKHLTHILSQMNFQEKVECRKTIDTIFKMKIDLVRGS